MWEGEFESDDGFDKKKIVCHGRCTYLGLMARTTTTRVYLQIGDLLLIHFVKLKLIR